MLIEPREYDGPRFWSKVKKTEGCWTWQSTTTGNGYGRFLQGGKYLRAHRVSYEMCWGEIPEGLVVAHKCDQPGCVNPEHLFACTQAENLADMARKGRARNAGFRGEQCGNSRLMPEQVVRIRQLATVRGLSYSDIGNEFGVTRQAVFRIVKRLAWAHIP